MARYTGPKTKIARKFGEPIFGDDKSFEKRNYPPGQHGNNKRRSKKSEYAIQLMESKKRSIHMVFLKNSLEICSKEQLHLRGSLVKFYFNYANLD